MNFKKTGMLLLVMSVLLITATGGRLRGRGNPLPQESGRGPGDGQDRRVSMEYQFSGQGQAEIVAVKSPVGGMLSEFKVNEGSLVDAGQDLAVLNAGTSNEDKEAGGGSRHGEEDPDRPPGLER